MTTYNIDWQSGGDEGITGKSDILLPQNTLDTTSTSLTLTGKGVSNWGEIQQENFIRLMENFASGDPPPNPTIGQLWFNPFETILYLYIDPAIVGDIHPRYYPSSPAAWVQIWPTRVEAYGVSEYNAMAININRIIDTPSVFGANPDVADNQWGWGQTDLVPVYTNVNTLAGGFTAGDYPAGYHGTFDNRAWVILLSRLRKISRHLGLSEGNVSPVGFIDDGRPAPPNGDDRANAYNDFAGPGTLPDYMAGWSGYGLLTIAVYYAATLSALSTAEASRFSMTPASSANSIIVSASRVAAWNTTVSHTITVNFGSVNAAKAFFNSGGYFRFNGAIAGATTPLGINWTNFLAGSELTGSGLYFDYKGFKRGAGYVNAPTLSTSLGFYDLTGSLQLIFAENRDAGLYYYITDGGYRVSARYVGSLATLEFVIEFVESIVGGDYVDGTLTSSITAFKPNSLNVNSPVIAYPGASSTAIA